MEHNCRLGYENMVARALMDASGTLCGDIVPSVSVYVCPDCDKAYYESNPGVEPSENYPMKKACHDTIDAKLAMDMDGMQYQKIMNLCMYGVQQ